MRLQLLLLPLEEVDGKTVQPFALVVDQFDDRLATAEDLDRDLPGWSKFALECGARSVLVTPQDVEVLPQARQPIEVSEAPEGSERAQVLAWLKARAMDAGDNATALRMATLYDQIAADEHLKAERAEPREANT